MWHRVWIRERKLATRTTYYVCWYGADGRQKFSLVGTDKRLARELCRKKEMELNSGAAGEPVPISFETFVREHLEVMRGRLAPGTLASQRQAVDRLSECVAPRRLTDIDHCRIERFIRERCGKVRPASVNKEIRTLRGIFARAVKRGYLKENPFRGAEMLREPEKLIRVLTLDEIDRLLEAAPSLRWRAFLFLALTTGMRLGELCNLEWDDVDLDNGVVMIQNKDNWQTKSRRARKLALTGQAVTLLSNLRHATASTYVFETRDGRPLSGNTRNVRRDFKAILAKAGIRNCTVHDLRRTFVSYLAMAGVNEAIVQKLAGHASIATTLKHYTHILPESLRRAQESLPYAKTDRPMLTLYGQGAVLAVQEKTA